MSARKSSSWRKKAFYRIAARDGLACAVCGVGNRKLCVVAGQNVTEEGHPFSWVYFRTSLELEHVLPLHLGGTNDDDNLRLLCAPCHRAKTSAEQSARLKALGAGRNA